MLPYSCCDNFSFEEPLVPYSRFVNDLPFGPPSLCALQNPRLRRISAMVVCDLSFACTDLVQHSARPLSVPSPTTCAHARPGLASPAMARTKQELANGEGIARAVVSEVTSSLNVHFQEQLSSIPSLTGQHAHGSEVSFSPLHDRFQGSVRRHSSSPALILATSQHSPEPTHAPPSSRPCTALHACG